MYDTFCLANSIGLSPLEIFSDWLRLRDSRTIDHYVIIGLSLVGVLMMLCGVFRLLGALLLW